MIERLISIKINIIIFLFFITFCILVTKKPYSKIPAPHQKTNSQLIESIDEINENIEKINSLCFKKVKVKLTKGLTFKAKANLSFKKDKNLRINVENFLGKVMEIGSNEEIFWFWSKYWGKDYYFSNHQDLEKVNLKTFLHPDWLLESMGLKKINTKNVDFIKNNLGIIENKKNISVVTFFDNKENIVSKKCLYENNKMVASVEYKNYTSLNNIKIPKTLVVSWYEENIFMEWEIQEIEINSFLEDSNWNPPKEKINLASSYYEE